MKRAGQITDDCLGRKVRRHYMSGAHYVRQHSECSGAGGVRVGWGWGGGGAD